ncbi:acyltransferase family protein [Nocardiopsis mangrovi]|uniref:Acyltransferase family protein n=1 Tax=Nocardiopsis mangrovi TaxID=1179818 RepID=A0ABV9DPV3_9ACTN
MWTVKNPDGQEPPRGPRTPMAPPPPEAAPATGRRRYHYLDNLKLLLIVLVVVHHASQPYGPADWWYFEGDDGEPLLGTLSMVSGAFRMALFFLIAAFLLPPAFDSKGGRRFVGDRFRSFLPPILVGFFVLVPALMYGYYLNFRDLPPLDFPSYYLDVYLGLGDEPAGWTGPIWPDRQFAHLWFLQHLLGYVLLYAGWRWITARFRRGGDATRTTAPRSVPQAVGTGAIVAFTAVVALATFVLRIWYPVDQWVPMLEFIQTEPADMAQYGFFFLAGVAAYRRGWLEGISARAGYAWLAVAVALGGAHFAAGGRLEALYAMGGFNAGNLLWSAVETTICVGLSLGLLVVFREWADRPNRLLTALAPLTFSVYVLHVPVVVGFQYALAGVPAGAVAKFAVVSVAATVVSFAAAWLVRRTPVLRRLI